MHDLATRGPILVVDDHALIATTLVLALRAQGKDAHHVPVANAVTILAEAGRHRPGLVLLDLYLGSDTDKAAPTGVDLVAPLRALGWHVLIVTAARDERAIAAAIAQGAAGWVSKAEPFEHMLRMALDAAAGRDVLPRAVRDKLLQLHWEQQQRSDGVEQRLARLSARERQVLDRLAAGQPAATIAQEFTVSLATVRAQIRAILAKLEVSSQLAAVAMVHQQEGA